MKEITPFKADLILVAVAFIWGTSYVIVKSTIDILEPMQIAFIRFFIASILSLILYGKNIKTAAKDEAKAGIILGLVLSFALYFALNGIKYTTVSKNSFIISTNVIVVPFLHWAVYKKRPSSMSIIAVFLMAVGLGFLTLDFSGDFEINMGDVISFGCVFFLALHLILVDNYSKKYNPVILNSIAMITISVLSAGFLLMTGNFKFAIPGDILFPMLYLGVFPTFLCYTLQVYAQKHTIATHAAIIISLESVFATILAVVFLDEDINLQMTAGFIFIFISVLVSELGDIVLKRIKEKDLKLESKIEQ